MNAEQYKFLRMLTFGTYNELFEVIDADGINVLCEDTDILKYASCPTVITPHAKEFARLFGKRIIPNNKTLQEFAVEYNTTIVYKEAETRIASFDNTLSILKNACCSGLAKGGSGDVLAGLIGSLLAQGYNTLSATVSASLAHSLASQKSESSFSLTPLKLIEYVEYLEK